MKLKPAAALVALALSLTACTGKSGSHDFDTLPGDFEITETETSTGSTAEDTETEPVTGTTADVTDAETTAQETEPIPDAQTTAETKPESETTVETPTPELPEKVGSVFPSPDGNYSIVCLPEDYDPSMHLDPFMLSPSELALVDSGGNVLASSSSGFNDDNGFKVFWSADSGG